MAPFFDKMLRVREWGFDCIDAFKVAEGCPVRVRGGWIRAIAFEATPCWKTGGKLGQIDDIRWLRG